MRTTSARQVATVSYRELAHASEHVRVFAAFTGRRPVGFLTVDTLLETVELVFVCPERRREGLATALLGYARRRTGLALDHDSGDRTLMGSRWARAQGLKVAGGYCRVAQRHVDDLAGKILRQIRDLA